MTSQCAPGGGDRPPSARSIARLAEGLEGELHDLRVAVDDELRLAKVLRDAGEVDAARLLLERPVSRTRAAQSRLRELIAAAAVERAAEEVLASADVGAPPPRDRRRGVRVRRVPAVLATVLALLVVMVLSSPDQGPSSPSMVASENGSTAQVIATILRIETGRLGAGTASDAEDVPVIAGAEDPRAPAAGPFGPRNGPDGAASAGDPVVTSGAIVGWFDASLLSLRRTAATATDDQPGEAATTQPTSEVGEDLADEAEASLDDPDDGATSLDDEIRDVVTDLAPSDEDGADVVSRDEGR